MQIVNLKLRFRMKPFSHESATNLKGFATDVQSNQ